MNFKGLFQISWVYMYLSMLSLRGGPRAYVRNLTSIASPTLRNLTKDLGPRVGTFAFNAQGNRTKSHHPMCLSVCSAAIKALKDSCLFVEVSTCFYIYKNTTSHHSFSILIDGTPYIVGIVWIVDDMDSLFVRESSVGSQIFFIHWLGGGYLIRFDQILGHHVRRGFWPKFFWKVDCSTSDQGPTHT